MDKIKDSEKALSNFSGQGNKDGVVLSDENSHLVLDLIRQLSSNVEMLNVEIRTRNQLRLNTLARRVRLILPSSNKKNKSSLN